MPRSRSIRTIIAEVVIYIGLFAIVGHLCQNLCERFLIHTELKSMKSDLNSLEAIVNNIGIAYDTLRDDIKSLIPANCKPITNMNTHNRSSYNSGICCKPKHTFVQNLNRLEEETNFEKFTKDFMQNFKKSTSNFEQYWNAPSKNETTLTEHLVRCVNINDDESGEESNMQLCKCIAKCISDCASYKLLPLQDLDMISNNSREMNLITNDTISWMPSDLPPLPVRTDNF